MALLTANFGNLIPKDDDLTDFSYLNQSLFKDGAYTVPVLGPLTEKTKWAQGNYDNSPYGSRILTDADIGLKNANNSIANSYSAGYCIWVVDRSTDANKNAPANMYYPVDLVAGRKYTLTWKDAADSFPEKDKPNITIGGPEAYSILIWTTDKFVSPAVPVQTFVQTSQLGWAEKTLTFSVDKGGKYFLMFFGPNTAFKASDSSLHSRGVLITAVSLLTEPDNIEISGPAVLTLPQGGKNKQWVFDVTIRNLPDGTDNFSLPGHAKLDAGSTGATLSSDLHAMVDITVDQTKKIGTGKFIVRADTITAGSVIGEGTLTIFVASSAHKDFILKVTSASTNEAEVYASKDQVSLYRGEIDSDGLKVWLAPNGDGVPDAISFEFNPAQAADGIALEVNNTWTSGPGSIPLNATKHGAITGIKAGNGALTATLILRPEGDLEDAHKLEVKLSVNAIKWAISPSGSSARTALSLAEAVESEETYDAQLLPDYYVTGQTSDSKIPHGAKIQFDIDDDSNDIARFVTPSNASMPTQTSVSVQESGSGWVKVPLPAFQIKKGKLGPFTITATPEGMTSPLPPLYFNVREYRPIEAMEFTHPEWWGSPPAGKRTYSVSEPLIAYADTTKSVVAQPGVNRVTFTLQEGGKVATHVTFGNGKATIDADVKTNGQVSIPTMTLSTDLQKEDKFQITATPTDTQRIHESQEITVA
ncbi:hypothetical protein PMI16_02598 [Herbaspirillum sp. CF444]|uniref:hypothetical protein n=1 Tax=Herbaspirillum sp. CF444 TaxID=1144319 RepID=UPI00027257D6|nr:hypothetical protein [Herbaspirillum sp. CF444]EJL88102.1 hypothetical protein PMI16_02598 [Herbaspirillum sp. CF444]